MRANQAFPSRYLTAADLQGTRPVVTIERVFSEEIGGEPRRCVSFVDKEKILPLNKTNWNAIAEALGIDDDEHWEGHAIRLFTARVDFQGKRVDAVRVERVSQAGRPAPREPEAVTMPTSGDVPF